MTRLGLQLRKRWRFFARRKEGATAVELALVGVPFFFTLFALAEIAVMSIAQSNLDFAISETARRIRTGEVQQRGMTAADVEREVCDGMRRVMPVDCAGRLFVDIRRFDAFTEVAGNDPAADGVLRPGEFAFQPGRPSDIVLARAFYRWELFTPFFDRIFANVAGGDRLMSAAILFRNEPWPEAPAP
jgi:Flp pilus assembly protein TadG